MADNKTSWLPSQEVRTKTVRGRAHGCDIRLTKRNGAHFWEVWVYREGVGALTRKPQEGADSAFKAKALAERIAFQLSKVEV